MRTTGHHRKWSGNGERNGPSIDVYKSARTREASTRKTPFPRDFLSLSLSRSLAGVIERWIKKKTELSPSKDAYHANIPFPRTSNLRQECLTFPVVHDIVIACNSRQRREKESGEVITAADISIHTWTKFTIVGIIVRRGKRREDFDRGISLSRLVLYCFSPSANRANKLYLCIFYKFKIINTRPDIFVVIQRNSFHRIFFYNKPQTVRMEYPENLTIKSDSVETYNRTKKNRYEKEKKREEREFAIH